MDLWFHNLLQKEADLVYYGKFTYSDIQKMKPIEVDFHIGEINRRIKAKEKANKRK